MGSLKHWWSCGVIEALVGGHVRSLKHWWSCGVIEALVVMWGH